MRRRVAVAPSPPLDSVGWEVVGRQRPPPGSAGEMVARR